jgi:Sec-independent protein secretion pathway component TatC
MNRRLARLLLRSYRPEWRAQYGQELEDLLCRRAPRISDILDVLWSGFVERIRQPFFGLWFCLLAGSAVTFLTSLIFAQPLWRILAAPVSGVLRDQGMGPRFMVQVTPFEGIEVVWLGIPALVTVFVTFALMLMLVWIYFSDAKEIQKRRCATRFVASSGSVFAFCTVLSFLAWRNGSIARLLQLYPDVRNAPLLSIGHCFVLLAASTMGVTLVLQIPIVTFFIWRFRATQDIVGPATL